MAKKIVTVLIILASVIALSAFFHLDFYPETEKIENEEIFLPEGRSHIIVHGDVDQAHMLGEPFYFNVKVRYDADKIKIYPESLQYADYSPLEPTGKEFIKHEKVKSAELKDVEKTKN